MLKRLNVKTFLHFHKGFSLVELIIATAISVMVFSLVNISILAGDASYRVNETKVIAQSAARQAMDNMVRELRGASNIAITQNATSSQITFNRSGHGTITYAWSSSGVGATNRILKNNTQIIGYKISALSFVYNNTDTVTIDLTATESKPYGRPVSVNLKENVTLRLL